MITPARIRAALRAARGAGPAVFGLTAWPNRSATFARSGLGHFVERTTSEFVADLAEDAEQIVAKGEGPCFTLGSSSGGGSTDEECVSRHGLTLDLDARPVRSDGTIGIEAVEAALQEAGIAYAVQIRAGKAHVHIPFAEPWAIGADAANVRERKPEFTRIVDFVIAVFETLAGVEFDHHEGARLLGLTYVVQRRREDEEVTTYGRDGAGLNLAAFVAQFEHEVTAHAPARPRAAAVAPVRVDGPPGLSVDEAHALVVVAALKQRLSVASAPIGHRHTANLRDAWRLVASTLEVAARDSFEIAPEVLRDAIERWFEPRIAEQERQGFDPTRSPAADLENAVASAVERAYSAGGKVEQVRKDAAMLAVLRRGCNEGPPAVVNAEPREPTEFDIAARANSKRTQKLRALYKRW